MTTTTSTNYGFIIPVVSWVEVSIGAVLMSMRFYSSWRLLRNVRADFYAALATFTVAFIGQIFLEISVKYGLGHPIESLSTNGAIIALKFVWLYQLSDIVAITLGKIAVIIFLQQIHGSQNVRPYFLWFVGATTVMINATTIALILAQCSPVAKLWDDGLSGNCNGRTLNEHFAFFQGGWSAFCDTSLALYPIYVFWKLQMKTHVKVALCVILGFGMIAAVCSAIKTSELTTLSQVSDITYFISPLVIWTSTETWLVLIAGCIPPIRPLFLTVFRNMTSNLSQSKAQYNSRYGTRTGTIALTSMSNEPERGNRAGAFAAKDNSSEEQFVVMKNQIVMTTDVDVNYDDADVPKERLGNGLNVKNIV